MHKPRVGLRAFLLMATLASILAATIATWARAGRHYSALEHGFQAQRLRVEAAWCEERIGWSGGGSRPKAIRRVSSSGRPNSVRRGLGRRTPPSRPNGMSDWPSSEESDDTGGV